MTTPVSEIIIEALAKSFDGHHVLDRIDLNVAQGDVLAIVGGSGSGKTVLMNLMLGQLLPDRGSIQVIDHSDAKQSLVDLGRIGDFQLDEIHKHWAVVFQRNALFSGSVFENIALWLREVKGLPRREIVAIAEKTLAAVGLPADRGFLRRPHEELSGGMAKRLAVARALAMDPFVIFYDEPTTGLDPASSTQIHNLIYDTHFQFDKRTTIIITHDKDLLQRLRPRTVMLHDGRIFFDGPFAEFEASQSSIVRPYFDSMPILHKTPGAIGSHGAFRTQTWFDRIKRRAHETAANR